jgi:hypothetical protein
MMNLDYIHIVVTNELRELRKCRARRARGRLRFVGYFVDVPPVPDIMQINPPLIQVELVNDPIIANSQFELRTGF